MVRSPNDETWLQILPSIFPLSIFQLYTGLNWPRMAPHCLWCITHFTDANIPPGEALARQMIFLETCFGIRCEMAWLPDLFGLTGALPQLMSLARMCHFFTQKLSYCVPFLANLLFYIPRTPIWCKYPHFPLFCILWPRCVDSND